MRNFIISLICISFLLSSWFTFSVYSKEAVNSMQFQANHLINNSIMQNKWAAAEDDYRSLFYMWNKYKKIAAFFLDSEDINEIDCTLDKAYLYMMAEDISNSTGEFDYAKDRIRLLYENERFNVPNIF